MRESRKRDCSYGILNAKRCEWVEKQEKRNQLARDVLLLSRNTLLVNLRFLDMALSRLELFASDNGTLQCDGEYLVYNSAHVLRCYKSGKEIPVNIVTISPDGQIIKA